jgi:hypothetical protein
MQKWRTKEDVAVACQRLQRQDRKLEKKARKKERKAQSG